MARATTIPSAFVVAATAAQALYVGVQVLGAARASDPRGLHANERAAVLGSTLATPAIACALYALAPQAWESGRFTTTSLLGVTTLACALRPLMHLRAALRGATPEAGDRKSSLDLLLMFGALVAQVAPGPPSPVAARLTAGAVGCALAQQTLRREDVSDGDRIGIACNVLAHACGHVTYALVITAVAHEATTHGVAASA